MEPYGRSSDPYRSPAVGGSNDGSWRRHFLQLSAYNLIQAPLSALLDYSGILQPRSSHRENEGLITGGIDAGRPDDSSAPGTGGREVSIRIISTGDQGNLRGGLQSESTGDHRVPADQIPVVSDRHGGDGGNEGGAVGAQSMDSEANVDGGNTRDLPYQQVARWLEQILPFSLLLLVVFVRQHLEGFFFTIWIAAVMFKSNENLRKQTALKGERRISVLLGIMLISVLQVVGVYWWYGNEDLLYPLFLHPPTEIPPFWHAIFIIMVNDTMVRQAIMVFKCVLLMYHKKSMGRNYRKQGQMLTLVEYLLLLYRALLPTSVWYRFFLNNEYGSFFSSINTGIYLTFKLIFLVEKVRSFFAALKGLSRKEMHYGSYATTGQVIAAGDLCAICQEKVHAPILLCCKHIFCEDCISEWFERERTCPVCRALVKPAGLRSFGDGSTSMFFQFF